MTYEYDTPFLRRILSLHIQRLFSCYLPFILFLKLDGNSVVITVLSPSLHPRQSSDAMCTPYPKREKKTILSVVSTGVPVLEYLQSVIYLCQPFFFLVLGNQGGFILRFSV